MTTEGTAWLRAEEIEGFLGQTKVWRNRENQEVPISDLEADHALNILWFLEKKADELRNKLLDYYYWAAAEADAMFTEAPAAQMEPDAVTWMRKTELYRAIAQHAYRSRAH